MATASPSAPSAAASAASVAAASGYQRTASAAAKAGAAAAVQAWQGIDAKNLDLSWIHVLPRILAVITGAQRKAAAASPAYLERIAKAQHVAADIDGRLSADAFGGITGDGRPLATLLYAPVALSKQRIGQGIPIPDVMEQEAAHLAMLATTVVQDAGRMAVQAEQARYTALRGYVRHCTLPSCARCIILAGRFYRRSSGFLRHPHCDCVQVPCRGEEWVSEQDPGKLMAQMRSEHPASLKKSLTEGDLRALDHGADLNQVVNAHRGMSTADAYGKTVRATSEGTTKRGVAGKRLIAEAGARRAPGSRYSSARAPRLTPAQLFEEAESENWADDEIVRQLKRFGYII